MTPAGSLHPFGSGQTPPIHTVILHQRPPGLGCPAVGALCADHRGRAGTSAVTSRPIANPLLWPDTGSTPRVPPWLLCVPLAAPLNRCAAAEDRAWRHTWRACPVALRRHPSPPEAKRTSHRHQADIGLMLLPARSLERRPHSPRPPSVSPSKRCSPACPLPQVFSSAHGRPSGEQPQSDLLKPWSVKMRAIDVGRGTYQSRRQGAHVRATPPLG